MTPDELRGLVDTGEIDTVVVGFTDHYGRLMGKRFDAGSSSTTRSQTARTPATTCSPSTWRWTPVAGYEYANWELGYGDFHLVPDIDTLRRAGWAERTAIVLCDVSTERRTSSSTSRRGRSCAASSTGSRHTGCRCRRLRARVRPLRRRLPRAHEKGFAGLERPGGTSRTTTSSRAPASSRTWAPRGGRCGDAASRSRTRRARPRSASTSSTSATPTSSPWPTATSVMKHGMKELADAHGRQRHVHGQARTPARRATAATSTSACGTPPARRTCSTPAPTAATCSAGSSAGGWPTCRSSWPVYAPTVNSYKRFETSRGRRPASPGRPTTGPPGSASSAPGRACGSSAASPGPTATRTSPTPRRSPPASTGSNSASSHRRARRRRLPGRRPPHVPRRLRDAVAGFAASAAARAAFGDRVVDHYAHFYEAEVASFEAAVTDWERARYFERI